VKLPSYSEAGLREKVFKDQYKDLPDYLQGFAYTCAVMQNAENIERIAYELAQDNLAEGVRYVEVRFGPQLHIHDQFSMEQVVRHRARGMERAQKEHNRTPAVKSGEDLPFHFGIIVCALRFFNEYMSPYYAAIFRSWPMRRPKRVFAAASLELARAAAHLADDLGLPVVGFDLGGRRSRLSGGRSQGGLPVRAQPLPAQDRARGRGLRTRIHLPGHHGLPRQPHRPRHLAVRRMT
jgi:adenosine deaminase